MKFFETSKYHSFKKSTYVTLRWIGIVGQLIAVNFVYLFLNSEYNFVISNIVIFFGILSNLYLIFVYKKTQLSDRSAFLFLLIDILQLGVLLYLSGGVTNPFVIFILIPSVFSSSNLSFRTNALLVLLTIVIILFLTFLYQDLPINLNSDFHNNHYYYYSIPISLIIALVFLNYFAMTFGTQSRLRKEALGKMEEVMAKEHELLSLGGQAAAAAHSLGTPLSTITIIAHDLMKQFKGQKDLEKDIELLNSQVERCNEILKRLTLNPVEEDEFIDKDINIRDYLNEIILSFKEISKKDFVFNFDQDSNPKKISKSIEIVYGLRNFIGNANKFSKDKIEIFLKSNNMFTEILIKDDGPGFPKDLIDKHKLGEPYIRSADKAQISKYGFGLGTFIGKTLLEKNFAKIKFDNFSNKSGAKVTIFWKNSDLISRL